MQTKITHNATTRRNCDKMQCIIAVYFKNVYCVIAIALKTHICNGTVQKLIGYVTVKV